MKKAARKDKEQCAKIEQNHSDGKDSEAYKLVKQLTGGFTRTNARVIKDAQGTLLTQQDDILKRWTEYAKQLYSDTGEYDISVLSNLEARHDGDDNEEDATILREEVELAIKKLKDRKSPGVDGIPSELIKVGRPALMAEIRRLCNMIWQQEE